MSILNKTKSILLTSLCILVSVPFSRSLIETEVTENETLLSSEDTIGGNHDKVTFTDDEEKSGKIENTLNKIGARLELGVTLKTFDFYTDR